MSGNGTANTQSTGSVEVVRKKKKKLKTHPDWGHHVVGPTQSSMHPTHKVDVQKYGSVDKPCFKGKPARSFPDFTPKPFQNMAFSCLERRESLIFLGHPSGGKDLVAEYTFGMAFRDNQKVLCVCSNRSLCYRKLRDLKASFEPMLAPSIHLLDKEELLVDLPNANCLICETSMLMRLLLKESPILGEVAWIVFDDVIHGGRLDGPGSNGGLEESLMLLRPSIGCVFLVSWIMDLMEFAGWFVSLNGQVCHVIHTQHRKPSLKHFAYPSGGEGLFFLKDYAVDLSAERFEGMQNKMKNDLCALEISEISEKTWWKTTGKMEAINNAEMSNLSSCVTDVLAGGQYLQFLPCAVFCFSAQTAEKCCVTLANSLDYIKSPAEKAKVKQIITSVTSRLDKGAQDLSMIQGMQGLLMRGVGLYHAGILPVLKELLELLAELSLLKILCTTEEYARYGRFPLRCVLLTGLYRPEVQSRRMLFAWEHARMLSLAGRSSIDGRGLAVSVLQRKLKVEDCLSVMNGTVADLVGLTSVSDQLLLSLIRKFGGVEDSINIFLKRSFEEYKHQKKVPQLRLNAENAQRAASTQSAEDVANVVKYKEQIERMVELREVLMKRALRPDVCLEFLQPGRLVRIKEGWGWGVLLSVDHYTSNAMEVPYIVNVLLRCETPNVDFPKPSMGDNCNPLCLALRMDMIDAIGMLRMCLPNTLVDKAAQNSVLQGLQNLEKRYPDGVPQLDIIQDMGLMDSDMVSTVNEMEQLWIKIHENPAHAILHEEHRRPAIMAAAENMVLAQEMNTTVKSSPALALSKDVEVQFKVLQSLGYVDADRKLTVKGVAACEIEVADPTLCLEFLSSGGFDGLDGHITTAIASMLLRIDGGVGECQLLYDEELSGPMETVRRCAEKLLDVRVACGQSIDRLGYMGLFGKGLVYAMFSWSRGDDFEVCTRFTGLTEGGLVEAARKVHILMLKLVSCARLLGNDQVASALEMGAQRFCQGIAFHPSLYLPSHYPLADNPPDPDAMVE